MYKDFVCVSSKTKSVKVGARIRGQLVGERILITQICDKAGSSMGMEEWDSIRLEGSLWVWKEVD